MGCREPSGCQGHTRVGKSVYTSKYTPPPLMLAALGWCSVRLAAGACIGVQRAGGAGILQPDGLRCGPDTLGGAVAAAHQLQSQVAGFAGPRERTRSQVNLSVNRSLAPTYEQEGRWR